MQIFVFPTVNDGDISSSGTNSDLNFAGVTQGNFSLTGKRLTRTSPFSNLSGGLALGEVVTAAAPTVG